MVKKVYTTKEWDEREEYYQRKLTGLTSAKLGQTSNDVLDTLSKLDTLSTEAMFDFLQIERVFEKVNMDLKNAETELFAKIKMEQLEAGLKVTEAEVKSLIKKFLK